MFKAARVLLTGVTGYIGGRLLRRFEQRGRPVRGLVHPNMETGRLEAARAAARANGFDTDRLVMTRHAASGAR